MPRFDISRLRKEKGMSQNELANHLQMTQSFLSAIENGRSPLPLEKEERVCEIFGINDLNDYIIDKKSEVSDKKITELTDSDLFNQLLSRFHRQAHSEEYEHHHHDHHHKIDELEHKIDNAYARIDSLMIRNDRLNEENGRLREEIDSYRNELEKLRKENFELKKKQLEKT